MPDALWPCPSCGKNAPSEQILEEHKKVCTGPVRVTKAAAVPPVQKVPPKEVKIELTYKFAGTCPTCKTPVETIEIEIVKKYNVVAWCTSCRKQLSTRQVEKL